MLKGYLPRIKGRTELSIDWASATGVKLDEGREKVLKINASKGGDATAISERKESNTLESYIAGIRSIWGDGKDPELPFKVKGLMETLLASTSPDDPWMAQLIREGKPSQELYRDPHHGFIQMGHVHKQGHGNSPHDHGPCWVVYGSYQGVTEITTYRRTDDGKTPGRATLEKKQLHRLAPGVVHPYLPGDIHSTSAVQGPAVVFRFLSYDLNRIERCRYNFERGTISPA